MPDQERNGLTADVAALDPDLVTAVLLAPKFAKVLPSDVDRILDHVLRVTHGAAIDELAESDHKVELRLRAIEAAREEIAIETGLPVAEIDKLAEPYVRAATAPWLRKIHRW